jgi:hypothetical protein
MSHFIYCYAECRYGIITLSVVMLNVVMLNVVMLNVIMLSVVAPELTIYSNWKNLSLGLLTKIRLQSYYNNFFIIPYEWAQYARPLVTALPIQPNAIKHSSLLGSFLSCEENETRGSIYNTLFSSQLTNGQNKLGCWHFQYSLVSVCSRTGDRTSDLLDQFYLFYRWANAAPQHSLKFVGRSRSPP